MRIASQNNVSGKPYPPAPEARSSSASRMRCQNNVSGKANQPPAPTHQLDPSAGPSAGTVCSFRTDVTTGGRAWVLSEVGKTILTPFWLFVSFFTKPKMFLSQVPRHNPARGGR